MTTASENALYTTIKLRAFLGGNEISTGTGFFWHTEHLGQACILVITNKHVIEGADQLVASLHLADGDHPSGHFGTFGMMFNPGDDGIYRHPNPSVDLVALNFTGIYHQANADGKRPFMKAFRSSDVPTPEQWAAFDVMEDVIMIGCPRGIFDDHNNMPLVRRGLTATSLSRDYAGRSEFMVDMACFPGSSGSPVAIINNGGFNSGGGFNVGSRFHLVGILYAGPLISNTGAIVMSGQPRVEVAAMMHLGQVIKSTEILTLEKMVVAEIETKLGLVKSKA